MPIVASTGCGKGDATRPRQVPRAVWDLRFELSHGTITRRTYRRRLKKLGLDKEYK
jgi:hypothetical protein